MISKVGTPSQWQLYCPPYYQLLDYRNCFKKSTGLSLLKTLVAAAAASPCKSGRFCALWCLSGQLADICKCKNATTGSVVTQSVTESIMAFTCETAAQDYVAIP